MSVDNKAPEIRIKNFSGKWYEVALSSVIDVRSGKDYKHLGKGNIPVYGTGGYMLSVDSALSNDEDAIGIGRKGTIDKPCILRAPFWTVDTLFYAVPFPSFNLEFIFCLFQKIEWKKHDESTGVPSLSKIAINNVPVYATSELEQTAIGNYFQKLDTLINQHQQKHDKLSNIKKSMLEKMFPKQGKTIPEIRFKGFTGEWEEKILNNEVGLFSGLTYSPSDIRKSGTLVLRSSNVKNGQIIEADNIYVNPEVVNCSNVVEGDIIVVVRNGSRSLIGKHAQVTSRMNNTVIGAFMTGIRSKQPAFINALLDTNMFTSEVEKNLGATINQITNGSFKSMFFMFPTEDEQQEIGNYFQKLDALINQHQQQINKLNNIKQACLSKMFV
ncbi:restriction endonuclease subunit S [Salmonella enterica subsp. enterica serovar Ibadan]|uniref:Restriction endonuclease subunit S n=2 Tax=Salmonella enterica TaxID=28901 RepID=A0A750I236_SALER|nr:restriction endonuclease subunit S [Salmonella enterica]EBQ9719119.1 restriction endonuclease subunit S [Salmonella enterica subsp. enterica serovar Nagoya]EBV2940593.1 restriction endonuclease subunit S [Salmonella enterica subsp. enterica serovar Woodhull]EBW4305230.1 restriction endonuclease subunit S [Salmonella enterica subsp. enterica serovar Duisburg]ECC3318551.1 restriction endonuclease subunit S [Salmonella enterica subsp. enterica]EAX2647417.1 restriction endonuclease subunit S [S